MQAANSPTAEQIAEMHTDITFPQVVEITTDNNRQVIWVNVNGICLLRCCRISNLIIDGEMRYGRAATA